MPLISARPSLALERRAARSRPRRAPRPPGTVARPSRAPRPRRSARSAQWASGARSPLAPSEPCSGTTGVRPALSSASDRLGDLRAGARVAHRQRAGAQQHHRPHDLALDRRRPCPAACERISARCSSLAALRRGSASSPASRSRSRRRRRARRVGEPVDDRRALGHRPRAASAVSETVAAPRATSTTSAGVSPAPVSSISLKSATRASQGIQSPRHLARRRSVREPEVEVVVVVDELGDDARWAGEAGVRADVDHARRRPRRTGRPDPARARGRSRRRSRGGRSARSRRG